MDEKRLEGTPSKNYLSFIPKKNKFIACFLCYKLIIRGEEMEGYFITVKEFCERMKVSTSTVYRMIKARQIPAKKFGRHWKISESVFDEYRIRR